MAAFCCSVGHFFLLLSATAKTVPAATTAMTAIITYRVSKDRNMPLESGVGVVELDGVGVGELDVGLGLCVAGWLGEGVSVGDSVTAQTLVSFNVMCISWFVDESLWVDSTRTPVGLSKYVSIVTSSLFKSLYMM